MKQISFLTRVIGHFKTITKHRHLVMIHCFKSGLIKQGLLHDLSKYSFEEFFTSVKYYTGNRSPVDGEKREFGYSKCWLHHKGRNKHHYEYWFDLNFQTKQFEFVNMPDNYVLESACDRIAACKVYQKDNYKDDSAYNFLVKSLEKSLMPKDTERKLLILLSYLAKNGEKKAFDYYKTLYKKYKKTGSMGL